MIEKILTIKKASYSSNLNKEDLKKRIEDLFEQRALKLVGKFTSQNEFAAYDKWTIISWYIPNFKRNSAYLKGEIIKSEKGTLIKLKIKPNSALSIFSILSVLIGMITTIAAESIIENNQLLITGLIFIAVGIIYYSVGLFLRYRLQSNFEKYLDLQKV